MYAAHAEKTRQEESKLELQNCISLLEKAVSDNDRFSAVLEITKHIRFNTFTNNDREKVVSAMGFEFLSKLITMSNLAEECPSNLYRSIALSMLSTICIEPSVVSHPHMKTFVKDANNILINTKKTERDKTLIQMTSDGLNILHHVAHHPNGVELLINHNSFDFLLKFIENSHLKASDISKALTVIGLILKKNGDGILCQSPDKLNDVMNSASHEMGIGSDIQEKLEYAKALTMILDSISMVPVDINSPWVKSLASSVEKLLFLKLVPEDSEVFFYLFVSLVSHVGFDLLNIKGVDRVNMVKVVVARVTVEVYALLDGIGPTNASSRFSRLNKVYRVLSDLVQFVCGDFGESADTDTIILLYRKLVDISNTVMEFLFSISNQDVQLPRNHSVVLISVRVLAAMLSEITEDPSPTLLELLPFFNLLCQNVEYSDDVQMEVKNMMQGALENIKMMSLQTVQENSAENNSTAGATSNTRKNMEVNHQRNLTGHVDEAEDVHNSDETVYLNDSDITSQAESYERKHKSHPVKTAFVDVKKNKDLTTSLFYVPNKGSSAATENSVIDLENNTLSEDMNCNSKNRLDERGDRTTHGENISISDENIEEFLAYQEEVKTEDAKAATQKNRQRSIIARQVKRKKIGIECSDEDKEECDNWKLSPNDILGFLLPSYSFLVGHEAAVKVMAECDAFQTIVNFVEESTSETLAGKSSSLPESTTVNALEVLRLLFTENAEVASTLLCLLDFFEIAILSVPNLMNMPNPPPLTCLKIIEVSIVALRFYKRGRKRNSSLHRIKHSRSRYFKSVIDYLLSFYVIKHHRVNGLSLHIAPEFKDVWPMASNCWCGCLEGLCKLIKSMEDLQEMLVKTPILSQFLSFLAQCKPFDVSKAPEDRKKIIESYFDLLEASASASNALRGFVVHSKGVMIARKFKLTKLEQILDVNQGGNFD